MLTDGVRKVARQKLEGSSAQRLLLPLNAEHVELLLLLLAEGVTVAHLKGEQSTWTC